MSASICVFIFSRSGSTTFGASAFTGPSGIPASACCTMPMDSRNSWTRQRYRANTSPSVRTGTLNLKFNVPVRTEGDVFARYLCRVQELRESIGMVQQALAGMPEGPVKADAPKVVLPDREKMKTQMEALIYHFKIITEGFTVPAGEVYQAVESPRGEMGYYIVSDGTAKPYRVHMRGPSFANLQVLPKMCEGRLIADVIAAIGSIDVVVGDIDR